MYYKRHELLKKEQDKLENGGSASGTEQDFLDSDKTDYDQAEKGIYSSCIDNIDELVTLKDTLQNLHQTN